MTGPNFFLIGAARSGTTTLYKALKAHPQIYLPSLKEPHFYAYLADPTTTDHLYPDTSTARRRYEALFSGVAAELAIGDASTSNMVVRGAAPAIAGDIPHAKIIAILRHPIDRAFSHYRLFVSAGGEVLDDFAEAVRVEASRQTQGFPHTYRYLEWSRYTEQLRPFFDLFGRDQVLVHLYDDLCSNPEAIVRSTYAFLGVSQEHPVARVKVNNSPPNPRLPGLRKAVLRGRRGRILRKLVPAPVRRVVRPLIWRPPSVAPKLDSHVRAELTRTFDQEITQLEDLLRRDLSGWR